MQRTFAKKTGDDRSRLGPALAGLLILVLIGLSLAYVWRRSAPQAPPAVGKEVAETFVKQLQAGQADAAWESTTAEFKSDEGRESFARYAREHAALWPGIEFVEYRPGELNGLPRGQAIFRPAATQSGTIPQQVRFAVAQEEGVWKVEGIFLDP